MGRSGGDELARIRVVDHLRSRWDRRMGPAAIVRAAQGAAAIYANGLQRGRGCETEGTRHGLTPVKIWRVNHTSSFGKRSAWSAVIRLASTRV